MKPPCTSEQNIAYKIIPVPPLIVMSTIEVCIALGSQCHNCGFVLFAGAAMTAVQSRLASWRQAPPPVGVAASYPSLGQQQDRQPASIASVNHCSKELGRESREHCMKSSNNSANLPTVGKLADLYGLLWVVFNFKVIMGCGHSLSSVDIDLLDFPILRYCDCKGHSVIQRASFLFFHQD